MPTAKDSPGKIYELIPEVMARVGVIPKDQRAPREAGGYDFRGIDDCYRVFHPIFVELRMFTTTEVLEMQIENKTVFVKMATHFWADDGSCVTCITQGQGQGHKAVYVAMSGGMKYAFFETFIPPVTAESLDDPDRTHDDDGGPGWKETTKPAPTRKPSAKHEPGEGTITEPQSRKLYAMWMGRCEAVNQARLTDGAPTIPRDTWQELLRSWLLDLYRVTTTRELSKKTASDLISMMEANDKGVAGWIDATADGQSVAAEDFLPNEPKQGSRGRQGSGIDSGQMPDEEPPF